MVICLELGADLHTAQLMPLPLTVSCFSKIQIGFTFLVPAHLGSPGKGAVKRWDRHALLLPVLLLVIRFGDNVDNTAGENSSVYSLICWSPSARACRQ